MLHLYYFITRKPGMAESEFHRYWREVHAPIVEKITELRRYVQSHRLERAGTDSSYDRRSSPYDGAAEALVDGLEALGALRGSSAYLNGALRDEPNFIDMARVEWMVTADHVIVEGPTGKDLVKGIWQVKRKPGMSRADFQKYWIEIHGGLGRELPGLRRYVQSHLIEDAYRCAEPRHDGVAALWFDDPRALEAAFESPAGRKIQEDGPKAFDMDLLRFFLAREHVVIPGR